VELRRTDLPVPPVRVMLLQHPVTTMPFFHRIVYVREAIELVEGMSGN
jgi:hypothetical protein